MTAAAPRENPTGWQATGEFAFTRDDFSVIARTLYDEAGIHLPTSKATLVYSRIAKRLRALGLESFRDYCALIGAEGGAGERAAMIAALTTNVTRFFREPHHFTHLKASVLPPLLRQARDGRRLRIWSAGCSSGPEPYSIALTILQLMPDARSFDIRILATDINPNVLQVARDGVYTSAEVDDIPADLRRTWMEPWEQGGPHLVFDKAVRGLVSFRELNLMAEWPMRGPFDAIFCRNVVIYFDENTQMRIWNRMLPLLHSGGYLYIGHSERVSGPAVTSLQLQSTTTYRKVIGRTS
ncbi:MAG: protein-glutamate O-methyltransferase [Alphaproteobacteria bacterium]|nr:protein-glutamate O-methyltransferase [Alphaproteobacteria bacterium]